MAYHIAIIGCDSSALLTGIMLRAKGVDCTIVYDAGSNAFTEKRMTLPYSPTQSSLPGFLSDFCGEAGEYDDPVILQDRNRLDALFTSMDEISSISWHKNKLAYRTIFIQGAKVDYIYDLNALIVEASNVAGITAIAVQNYIQAKRRLIYRERHKAKNRLQPLLDRLRKWYNLVVRHSPYHMVKTHISNERLAQSFLVPLLLLGRDPYATNSSIDHFIGDVEQRQHWLIKGGRRALYTALGHLFVSAGGHFIKRKGLVESRRDGPDKQGGSGDVVKRGYDKIIYPSEIISTNFDKISGGDIDLPDEIVFAVDFTVKGEWPGIADKSVLMPSDLEAYCQKRFQYNLLPEDMMINLQRLYKAESLPQENYAERKISHFRASLPIPSPLVTEKGWGAVQAYLISKIKQRISSLLVDRFEERIISMAIVYTPLASYSSSSRQYIIRRDPLLYPFDQEIERVQAFVDSLIERGVPITSISDR